MTGEKKNQGLDKLTENNKSTELDSLNLDEDELSEDLLEQVVGGAAELSRSQSDAQKSVAQNLSV